MRLFVAIVPPKAVLDDLAVVVTQVRDLPESGDHLRWTLPAQWHLTLAFLGDVDDRTRGDLGRRLARAAARSQPMRLVVQGGGGFGSARRARVLWAGVTGDVDPLRALADAVGAAARRCGIEVPRTRFHPHLTLARLRDPTDVSPQVSRLSSYTGPVWEAHWLELVRSHLGQGEGGRSRYETVQAWPLGGAADRGE